MRIIFVHQHSLQDESAVAPRFAENAPLAMEVASIFYTRAFYEGNFVISFANLKSSAPIVQLQSFDCLYDNCRPSMATKQAFRRVICIINEFEIKVHCFY